MNKKGGILLDAFFILVLIAIGAGVWYAWKQGKLPPVPAALMKYIPKSSAPAAASAVDVSEKSVQLQGDVRTLLVKHGIKEGAVLKTYNQEHQDEGVVWLEDTLDVRPPASFDSVRFMNDLSSLLAQTRLVLMDEKADDKSWVLELGDGRRVFQRLIVQGKFVARGIK